MSYLSDLDKSRMKHGGLLNKHISEKKSNISSETAETVNFDFSHYKSDWNKKHNFSFPLLIDAIICEI